MGADYGVTLFTLAMLRIAGSAAVFIPIYLAMSASRMPSWRDFDTLTILAVLGIVNNHVLYLAGLTITPPISATLLVAMIPVFTLSITALTDRVRLTLRQVSGAAISLFGIAILLDFTLPRLGDTLVLFNALSYALYVVYSKEIMNGWGH